MKYFIIILIVSICAVNICFAQTGMKSRDIISNKDAQMNKVNNDLNFYRSKNDGASNQKVMELERQKSKMINSK